MLEKPLLSDVDLTDNKGRNENSSPRHSLQSIIDLNVIYNLFFQTSISEEIKKVDILQQPLEYTLYCEFCHFSRI